MWGTSREKLCVRDRSDAPCTAIREHREDREQGVVPGCLRRANRARHLPRTQKHYDRRSRGGDLKHNDHRERVPGSGFACGFG